MADVTIRRTKGGKRNVKRKKPLKNDPWDNVFDENGLCRFCGHHRDVHGGRSAMVRYEGRKRRVRLGLDTCWCRECASDKQTKQVICYKIPSAVIERVHASGGTYYGYSGSQDG